MPKSKDQTGRLRIINECLCQKGSYWSTQELLDRLASADLTIGLRTLRKDISDMQLDSKLGYHAPIANNRRLGGYHYTDSDYSIDKLPLNKEDVKRLEWAATTLSQYQGIPFMNEFTTTIEKIIRVVNRVKRGNYETILDFIEFEKTPTASGLQHMDTIIEAIQDRSSIDLIYHSFENANPVSVIVHPYFIKEYRNRWYLIGLKDKNNAIRTYAYDRIVSITPSTALFKQNTFITKHEYLQNCIGVGLGSREIEHIILQFLPQSGKYVVTQPLHRSQHVISNDSEKVVISLDLIVNYELISAILSYGDFVKVLEPIGLAEIIAKKATQISKHYLAKT
jgi:predicted DNA-binding transcriptional regulator YafY